MKIDPVDHPGSTSEPPLDYPVTGQAEATTEEQSREPGFIIGWHNSSMRVHTYLARRDVSPQEAALLLYGLVPRRKAGSGEFDQPGANGYLPDDYNDLLSKFVETAKDGKCRCLLDWMKIAQESGLKHNTWLKLYLKAAKQLGIPIIPSDNGNAAEATGSVTIDSLHPAPRVSEATSISRTTAAAFSAHSLTINATNVLVVGQHVALAAKPRRIAADNNGQVASGDKDATGAENVPPNAQSISGDPESDKTTKPNGADIPGKLPKVLSGRLAVKAAWEIELETERPASCDDVMNRLQEWAAKGTHPETLIEAIKGKRAVKWQTKAGDNKIYDIDACSKTIEAWKKSRA